MKAAFADTVGLLALWDRSDQWHDAAERAFVLLAQNKTALYTTSFVLLECANAAARRPYRIEVDRLRAAMEHGGLLIHPTQEDWEGAWEAYAQGSADRAGVVDHVSFIVMRRLGLKHTFTNDHHFRAAGFELLFRRRRARKIDDVPSSMKEFAFGRCFAMDHRQSAIE